MDKKSKLEALLFFVLACLCGCFWFFPATCRCWSVCHLGFLSDFCFGFASSSSQSKLHVSLCVFFFLYLFFVWMWILFALLFLLCCVAGNRRLLCGTQGTQSVWLQVIARPSSAATIDLLVLIALLQALKTTPWSFILAHPSRKTIHSRYARTIQAQSNCESFLLSFGCLPLFLALLSFTLVLGFTGACFAFHSLFFRSSPCLFLVPFTLLLLSSWFVFQDPSIARLFVSRPQFLFSICIASFLSISFSFLFYGLCFAFHFFVLFLFLFLTVSHSH